MRLKAKWKVCPERKRLVTQALLVQASALASSWWTGTQSSTRSIGKIPRVSPSLFPRASDPASPQLALILLRRNSSAH